MEMVVVVVVVVVVVMVVVVVAVAVVVVILQYSFNNAHFHASCCYYRQHCAQRKPAVFSLLRGQF